MLTGRRIAIGAAVLAIISAAVAGWYLFVHEESGPAGEFDISDRQHSAFRISSLLEEVIRVKESADPIEVARGVVAFERIELLCNNFEIHEDLDLACDRLVQARGDSEEEFETELDAAAAELRSEMSRRELASFEVQEPWDVDITDFAFEQGIRQAMYDLMIAMMVCEEEAWTCESELMDQRIADFIRLRFPTIGAPPEDAQSRITYLSTKRLSELVLEFDDQTFGKDLWAYFIISAIDLLGIR